jgi:hypothetical protein
MENGLCPVTSALGRWLELEDGSGKIAAPTGGSIQIARTIEDHASEWLNVRGIAAKAVQHSLIHPDHS